MQAKLLADNTSALQDEARELRVGQDDIKAEIRSFVSILDELRESQQEYALKSSVRKLHGGYFSPYMPQRNLLSRSVCKYDA